MRTRTGVLLTGLLVAGLAACGSEDVIAPEELQRGVSDVLTQSGREHVGVTCEESVKAQVAESTTCVMDDGTDKFEVRVMVTEVAGDQASYEISVAALPMSLS